MSTEQKLITFYDNYKAPLTAGSYRLVLQQSVTLESEKPRHYYRDQRFEVLAPRYAIETEDIQAYFPPDGGVPSYKDVLPHLVLNVRNLPWERTLTLDGNEPWLALLILSEQEIVDSKAVLKRGTVGDLAPHRPDGFKEDDEKLPDWQRSDPN